MSSGFATLPRFKEVHLHRCGFLGFATPLLIASPSPQGCLLICRRLQLFHSFELLRMSLGVSAQNLGLCRTEEVKVHSQIHCHHHLDSLPPAPRNSTVTYSEVSATGKILRSSPEERSSPSKSMEDTEQKQMFRDIVLQVVMILFFLVTFLAMHGIPQRLFAWLRLPRGRSVRAKRHFVRSAQLLAEARTAKKNGSSSFNSLANEALTEADRAIALNPRDAASYLLKAMILDLQGFRTSALDAVDAALSPLAAKSLAAEERGDALVKRAELKLAVSERGEGRVDSAVSDLTESVKLNPKNARGWCLLGQCYEEKEMEDEAKKAYKEALELEPKLIVAEEALKRLSSS